MWRSALTPLCSETQKWRQIANPSPLPQPISPRRGSNGISLTTLVLSLSLSEKFRYFEKLILISLNSLFLLLIDCLLYFDVQKAVKKKGSYPLHPGVQGFFITCDGGRERQASNEAINVIDSVCCSLLFFCLFFSSFLFLQIYDLFHFWLPIFYLGFAYCCLLLLIHTIAANVP